MQWDFSFRRRTFEICFVVVVIVDVVVERFGKTAERSCFPGHHNKFASISIQTAKIAEEINFFGNYCCSQEITAKTVALVMRTV